MYYYAKFEEETGGYNVSFRDIPEALTCGDDFNESMFMAEDALLTAFTFYLEDNKPIPLPSEPQAGEVAVKVDACNVAKIHLHNALLKEGIHNAELARRLNISPQNIKRLTNPYRKTKIEKLEKALNVIGYDLNLSIRKKD